ncbi:MAG: type IV conjugative transfer system protein TraL [Simkaniaceae bacterium]|nr:type IV conjugative transfer system protein TraL [Simkaniaceae bacterium]
MSCDQHIILKHLDNPVRILSFSLQDIVIYALPLFIGALTDNMLSVPIVGFLLIFLAKRVLKKLPKFYLIRFFYWHLPTKQYNKLFKTNLPPSHKRLWVR